MIVLIGLANKIYRHIQTNSYQSQTLMMVLVSISVLGGVLVLSQVRNHLLPMFLHAL